MVRSWARVLVALLGLSAVVTEAATLAARGELVPSNFLSYFTIESNLLVAGVLLATVVVGRSTRALELWRGAATVCIATVFIVFSLLLSGLDARLTAVPWDNTVLHYLVPVLVVADWFTDPPPERLPLRSALWWLAIPAAYLAWSLVRGSIVGWYPYPFLDPANGGYGRVALTSVGIAVLVLTLTWVVTRVPRGARTSVVQGPAGLGDH